MEQSNINATERQEYHLKKAGKWVENMTKREAHRVLEQLWGRLPMPEPKDVTPNYNATYHKVPEIKPLEAGSLNDAKQRLIIRQCCIKAASEGYARVTPIKDSGDGYGVSFTNHEEVIKIAEEFEKWILR